MRLAFLSTLLSVSRGFELGRFDTEQSFLDELPVISVDSIPASDIESIVNRQWFEAAGELIRKSHETHIDISAPIRAGAQAVRARIDELVKLLDPDYSKPHRMNPAFQWTQNDTSVFIQLKYSRRFNAPGSVDVTDFNCTFTDTSMIFSAIGGHSGKMFEYVLDLDFFDSIDPVFSKWMEGSVGKVSLTIQKARASKWPRLLLDKSLRIDNMHYWFDFGEKQESILNAMPSVTDSGLTCSKQDSVYCSVTDKCVVACNEENCSGRLNLNSVFSVCEGPPTIAPKQVSFNDTNSQRNVISGSVEVTFSPMSFDIEYVNVYITSTGLDLTDNLSEFLRSSARITGNQTTIGIVSVDLSTVGMADLVVVPVNAFGENREKKIRIKITDAFAPNNAGLLDDVSFIDTDPAINSVKGDFLYTLPPDLDGAIGLAFYWGKSDSEKHKTKAFNEDSLASTNDGKYSLTAATPMPSGATHVLIFARGPAGGGEVQIGAVLVYDKYRPQKKTKPFDLQSSGEEVSFSVSSTENVSFYSIRVTNTKNQTKEVEVVEVSESVLSYVSPVATRPNYVQLCVYPGNDMGRSVDPECMPLNSNRSEDEL